MEASRSRRPSSRLPTSPPPSGTFIPGGIKVAVGKGSRVSPAVFSSTQASGPAVMAGSSGALHQSPGASSPYGVDSLPPPVSGTMREAITTVTASGNARASQLKRPIGPPGLLVPTGCLVSLRLSQAL